MNKSERETCMLAATALSELATLADGHIGAQYIDRAKSRASDLLLIANGRTVKPRPDGAGRTVETWNSYSEAYERRYNVAPIRNAKVSGMLGKFIDFVGPQQAPGIAAFYVQHNRSLYVASHHAIELLLRDYSGLRTQFLNGSRTTETAARDADRRENTNQAFSGLIADAERRERDGK